jgi:hypothetical protein
MQRETLGIQGYRVTEERYENRQRQITRLKAEKKKTEPGRITRKDIFLMVTKFCPQRDISMHGLFPAV